MSEINIFSSPVLFERILQHVGLFDQVLIRRVNKDFKHVIENVTWPHVKKLDLLETQLLVCEIEPIIRHMPNLKDVIFKNNNQVLAELIVIKLSRHCHKIKRFRYHSNEDKWGKNVDLKYGLIKTHEFRVMFSYAKLLCEQLIDIGENNFIFPIHFIEQFLMLDELPYNSKFYISYSDKNDGDNIPARYRDKIKEYEFELQDNEGEGGADDLHMPYYPNVNKIKLSDIDLECAKQYKDKIEHLIIFNGRTRAFFTVCLLEWHNLTTLDISLDFRTDLVEERILSDLDAYFNDPISGKLSSFRFQFYHKEILDKFILTLSCPTIRRPKWKFLDLCTKTQDVLMLKDFKLTYHLNWPYEPLECFKKLICSMNCHVINIKPYTDPNLRFQVKPSVHESQLRRWRNLMIRLSYSRTRNAMYHLKLWTKDDGTDIVGVSSVFTISFAKDLIRGIGDDLSD